MARPATAGISASRLRREHRIPDSERRRRWTDIPPEVRDIPHLVLYRNNSLTDAVERTIILTIRDLPAPTSGVTVTLRVETQHGDPDLGGDSDHRISVWQQAESIAAPSGAVSLTHTFDARAGDGSEAVATPTDYYPAGPDGMGRATSP